MRKELLILAMPIMLLMVGCAEEDASRDPQVNGSAMVKGMPIDFGTDDAGDTTRISPYLTRTAVNTLELSDIQTSGFGVFAAHTGLHTYANSSISSNFMHNQKVTYSSGSGGHWEYSPTKYWPNGEDGSEMPDYISFFAYAPYCETASACITDFPLPIEMGDPWLIYRLADDVASQVDLLYATPVLDKTKPASTATNAEKKVNFKFKHALACVGDKVTTSISEALGDLLKAEVAGKPTLSQIEVILRKVSIVYTLTQKGKLSLASSTALWKPVMSGEFTTKRTVTVFDSSTDGDPQTLATITGEVAANEYSVSDKGVFYIPLQVGNEPQQATCTIDYTIRRTISGTPTPTDFNGSTTKAVNLREAGGEIAGAHLNLELQLSDQISVKGKDLSEYVILPIAPQTYSGSALEPNIIVTNGSDVLVKDRDYTIAYSDNTNAGTATVTIHGMGDFDSEATLSATFTINPFNINLCTVEGVTDLTYNGTEQTIVPVVKHGTTTLTEDTHYTKAGTLSATYVGGPYYITFTGNGNYTGVMVKSWNMKMATGTLSYDVTSISKAHTETTPFTNPLTHVGDGTVSYTSSNTSVATIDTSTGEVSPTGTRGTTTITATLTGAVNYAYANTTATYTLRIVGPEDVPLTFEAMEAGATVQFNLNATAIGAGTVQYSTDGGEVWNNYSSGSVITLTNIGDKVQFQSTNITRYATKASASYFSSFSVSKNCYVYGNILSLVNYTITLSGSFNLAKLFNDCSKIHNHDSKNLLLPATTLTESCYNGMFYGCTSLTKAPVLPATSLAKGCYLQMFAGCTSLATAPQLSASTLAESCYSHMFYGCTSLPTAPALSATTLAEKCYNGMFQDCTSLTTAPNLPATTLAESCYRYMFGGCTSLATAPDLRATSLVKECYNEMFKGCTSLNSVKCLATNISAENCTKDWLYNVSATGTFTIASTMVDWSRDEHGIPSGWTIKLII